MREQQQQLEHSGFDAATAAAEYDRGAHHQKMEDAGCCAQSRLTAEGSKMTVGELKAFLSELPDDTKVFVSLPLQSKHNGDIRFEGAKAEYDDTLADWCGKRYGKPFVRLSGERERQTNLKFGENCSVA